MPTKIQWADETWSPVTGCTKISEGCKNCFAERMAKRQVAMGFARHERGSENDDTWIAYSNAIDPDTGRWSGEITCRYEKLDAPLHWRKPRRVFVNSMSDLFHENVPLAFVRRVWRVMKRCPQHTFLILTKRAYRMNMLLPFLMTNSLSSGRNPLPNVHLGVSAENQKCADERIPLLLQTPAAKRFVSLEPLLGPVDLDHTFLKTPRDLPDQTTTYNWLDAWGLDWVIVGAETGPGARRMDPQWARDIRDQCRVAGVSFFMKQMSGRAPIPNDLMIREFPE